MEELHHTLYRRLVPLWLRERVPERFRRLGNRMIYGIRDAIPEPFRATFNRFLGRHSQRAKTNAKRLLSEPGWSKGVAGPRGFRRCENFREIVRIIDRLAEDDPIAASRVRMSMAMKLFASIFERLPAKELATDRIRAGYVAKSPMPSRAANNVHIMKMCGAMKANGIDVLLAFKTQDDIDGIDDDRLFTSYQINDRFAYVSLDSTNHALRDQYRLVCAAIESGCTHIYTRSTEGAYFAALADMPTLLELHTPINEKLAPLARDLFRLPALRGVVSISHALRARLIRDFPMLEGRVHVIPDAADPPTENAAPFELTNPARPGLNIGYAGQLYPGKGMEIILQLAERLPQMKFHVMGGYETDIDHWKRQSPDLKNIEFYGFRPHAEVSSFLCAVDVVVAPYLRSVLVHGGSHDVAHWMSPLKIFEYMAHKRAIVSSDLPVLREVLEHRRNAMMCDPDDIENWTEMLQQLANDPELRKSIARTARADFEREHNWKQRAARAMRLLLHNVHEQHKQRDFDLPPAADVRGASHSMRSAERTRLNGSAKWAEHDKTPSVVWLYGKPDKVQWAYGINARRFASAMPGFDHHIGYPSEQTSAAFDLKVCFDILVHQEEAAARVNSGATIVRIGGPKPLEELSGGDAEKLREAFSDIDAVIALSPGLRDQATVFHDNVFFIPNGIDLDQWHPGALPPREPDRPFRVGMAASLKTDHQRQIKGYHLAKDACREAGIELLVVGRGMKQVPHENMIAEFYSQIDVLLHPVGPGKEASSNVIMESLALGIPVITTRYAGFHSHALRHGRDALIVPRISPAIAGALRALKDDGALRESLRTGGIAFVRANHDLNQIAKRYEQVFRSVLVRAMPNPDRRVAHVPD